MKVQLTHPTVAGANAGDIVDIPPDRARRLIRQGAAIEPPTSAPVDETEDPAPADKSTKTSKEK